MKSIYIRKKSDLFFKLERVVFFIHLIFMLFFFIAPVKGSGEEKKNSSSSVYVIPIKGEINRSMVVFLRRSIDIAIQKGAKLIVFDINTFGGRVDSALQITTLIGSIRKADTVAYVTTGAEDLGVSWSAGALICFSCTRIYMAPGTSIGAAAPVTIGPEGTEMASEKVVSAVRAQMAALAEKNGYNTCIAKAMVDDDIELQEIYIDGELKVVSSSEIEALKKQAEKEGKKFEPGSVISPSGKLLTLTAFQMEKYGVSSGTVQDIDSLLKKEGFQSSRLAELEQTPADKAVFVLTSSSVTGLIIMIGLVSLFLELTTPGFGIPGTIAIICFAVVFASYTLLGTVKSFELILFLLGLVLLILEIFVIPGFGIAGVLGITFIVASLILSMQGFVIPQFEWQKQILKKNVLVVLGSLVTSLVTFGVMAYFLPQIKPFSRLTLALEQNPEEGYIVQERKLAESFIGKKGKTVTVLRPSGKAEIDGEVYVVESDGEYIEAGKEVEIIEVSGNRIVVQKCENSRLS